MTAAPRMAAMSPPFPLPFAALAAGSSPADRKPAGAGGGSLAGAVRRSGLAPRPPTAGPSPPKISAALARAVLPELSALLGSASRENNTELSLRAPVGLPASGCPRPPKPPRPPEPPPDAASAPKRSPIPLATGLIAGTAAEDTTPAFFGGSPSLCLSSPTSKMGFQSPI